MTKKEELFKDLIYRWIKREEIPRQREIELDIDFTRWLWRRVLLKAVEDRETYINKISVTKKALENHNSAVEFLKTEEARYIAENFL